MRIDERLALVASMQFGLTGPFDCHVYALRGESGLVLIDSGAGTHTQQLLDNLEFDFRAVPVVALLITHAHADHCGGAACIRERTSCSVIAPRISEKVIESGDEEATGLRRAREQGLYSPEFKLRPCTVDVAVEDGQTFTAAGLEFTPIHVRGHSRDAHCYLVCVEGCRWLFTGDVVFYGGILGVVNAEGSGMEGYRSDIGKLAGLNVDGLFPGHGLFTVSSGQQHLDLAVEQARKGFLGRQIGQGDAIF